MKVLLVEDEKKMASFIQRGLKEEGYIVDIAMDGENAWELISENDYDLVLLDWMIPKINGLELCQKVRSEGKVIPIIMLTAKDSVEDKIIGLDRGADDYLAKPFAFDELLARIRALLRRPHELQKETVLVCGKIRMDLLSRKVTIHEKEMTLSQKEFALLEFLMRHKEQAVSRTQIAENVWDLHFDPMSNTVDVYINFLRKKIDGASRASQIQTVRGVGYRLLDS